MITIERSWGNPDPAQCLCRRLELAQRVRPAQSAQSSRRAPAAPPVRSGRETGSAAAAPAGPPRVSRQFVQEAHLFDRQTRRPSSRASARQDVELVAVQPHHQPQPIKHLRQALAERIARQHDGDLGPPAVGHQPQRGVVQARSSSPSAHPVAARPRGSAELRSARPRSACRAPPPPGRAGSSAGAGRATPTSARQTASGASGRLRIHVFGLGMDGPQGEPRTAAASVGPGLWRLEHKVNLGSELVGGDRRAPRRQAHLEWRTAAPRVRQLYAIHGIVRRSPAPARRRIPPALRPGACGRLWRRGDLRRRWGDETDGTLLRVRDVQRAAMSSSAGGRRKADRHAASQRRI